MCLCPRGLEQQRDKGNVTAEAAAKLPSKDQIDGKRDRLPSRGLGVRRIMKSRRMDDRMEGGKDGSREIPSSLEALCGFPT